MRETSEVVGLAFVLDIDGQLAALGVDADQAAAFAPLQNAIVHLLCSDR